MEYSDSALDSLFPGVSRSEALQAWYGSLTPRWREAFDQVLIDDEVASAHRQAALMVGYAIYGIWLSPSPSTEGSGS